MSSNCWKTDDSLLSTYHDEWGTPVHNDRVLFEFLSLEGMQAGLSWLQILKRRKNYQQAFNNFDPVKIANYKEADLKRLLEDVGIIRNRRKIESIINNAMKVVEIQNEFRSFDAYIWKFVKGNPIDGRLLSFKDMPSEIEESLIMSKELKKRGFKFVGPTICYSFMQAVGMVNDHLVTCLRYIEIKRDYPNG